MPFYILKKAIYLHGVYGPFETKRQATAAFQKAYKEVKKTYKKDRYNDFDGHHDYYLVDGLSKDVGPNENQKGKIMAYEDLT